MNPLRKPEIPQTYFWTISGSRAQVAALRFGAVHITVHDSKVIQIETTEKVRLDKTQPKSQKP